MNSMGQHASAPEQERPAGFDAVQQLCSWPNTPPFPPFPQGPLALAAGGPGNYEKHDGRWLVVHELQRARKQRPHVAPVLVEAGVFLGGSLERWLVGLPTVHVIGVDLFDNVTSWVDRLTRSDVRVAHYRSILPQLQVAHGSLLTVQSNLWRFRERAALVRGSSPQALLELARLGVRPDVVFLDNDKSMDDLWVAHALWPHATLAGDDWGHQWTYEQLSPVSRRPDVKKKRYNVTVDAAANVCAFASKMGFWVSARSLTWVAHKLPLPTGTIDACTQPPPSPVRGVMRKKRRERAGGKRWGRAKRPGLGQTFAVSSPSAQSRTWRPLS